jgi:N utilization substance protein A
MDIDLRVLKALESEKEIPFGELVEIIEGAILAAYQKTVGVIPKRDSPVTTRAQLDRKTGQVTIYDRPVAEDGTIADEEIDVTPENFGRIAAYSAKQVITTRLRAIADEGLMGEFAGKVGDIVMGTIQQGTKPHMIQVDLGDVEAMLPAEEQVPGEEYVHNKRN